MSIPEGYQAINAKWLNCYSFINDYLKFEKFGKNF